MPSVWNQGVLFTRQDASNKQAGNCISVWMNVAFRNQDGVEKFDLNFRDGAYCNTWLDSHGSCCEERACWFWFGLQGVWFRTDPEGWSVYRHLHSNQGNEVANQVDGRRACALFRSSPKRRTCGRLAWRVGKSLSTATPRTEGCSSRRLPGGRRTAAAPNHLPRGRVRPRPSHVGRVAGGPHRPHLEHIRNRYTKVCALTPMM